MLQYEKIDVSEGIETSKTSGTLKILDINLNHLFVINVTIY